MNSSLIYRAPTTNTCSPTYQKWPASSKAKESVLLLTLHKRDSASALASVAQLRISLFSNDIYLCSLNLDDNTALSTHDVLNALDKSIRHICANEQISLQSLCVLAQADAALHVSAWVHDYAPRLKAVVLVNPVLAVSRGLYPVAERVMCRLSGKKEQAHQLNDKKSTAWRVRYNAFAVRTPHLILADTLQDESSKKLQSKFFQELGTSVKKQVIKSEPISSYTEVGGLLKEFLTRPDCVGYQYPSEMGCDKKGVTVDEYVACITPSTGLMRLGEKFARAALKTAALLSKGFALGEKHGYDSGVMFDHVYLNKAKGVPLIGTAIDRAFLNSSGWVGVRARGANITMLLSRHLLGIKRDLGHVHLLDIAAGPGRYVLTSLRGTLEEGDSAILRDFMPVNVEQAKELISRESLGHLITAEHGNCFDFKNYTFKNAPNVVVIAGLFEQFPDNEQVLSILHAVNGCMAEGGVVLYTNQPWHHKLKLIAKLLINHDGKSSWAMRRRTQSEMDWLVSQAGFDKIEQVTDKEGMLSVSVARKPHATVK